MFGFIYGLFLHQKTTPTRITGAVDRIVCSLGLNTLWLTIITDSNFMALLSTRLLQSLVDCIVQLAVIMALQGVFALIRSQMRIAE